MKGNITYSDVVELGFDRINSADGVWERRYGFPYFIMHLELSEDFYLNWEIFDHTVEVLVMDLTKSEGHYKERYAIHTLEGVKAFINAVRGEIDYKSYMDERIK